MTMVLPDQPLGAPTSRLYLEREIDFHLFKPLFLIFVVIGIWSYILTNTPTLMIFLIEQIFIETNSLKSTKVLDRFSKLYRFFPFVFLFY